MILFLTDWPSNRGNSVSMTSGNIVRPTGEYLMISGVLSSTKLDLVSRGRLAKEQRCPCPNRNMGITF
ncbi:hypothetical protein INT46_003994 [Mucor plumbeus]|uniref:Uncharacterized protein n=1 Tax=Mucor plumbeus TaxID=97098 RepID=A0A8H7QD20_9FUNG|nr:hypothetical protein INT46_003994 [Mucor plumbeus]